MTRPEWDALEPREKDALVAEHVMGHEVGYVRVIPNNRANHETVETRRGTFSADPHVGVPISEYGTERELNRRERGRRIRLPYQRRMVKINGDVRLLDYYTTSWDAMGEVVEKMRADGWIDEHEYGDFHAVDEMEVWWEFTHTETAGGGQAYGTSDPETCAIAALTALGHMEP